ncbi:unnamed protein product [Clonostachys chloroleuca]|uniref:MYND-type domain-containing protein n=1 Tax=Clonostachys chloroleuca TaxID=1926264 RepID=A0AA35M8I3_9HYPO|nr:unnamed protein product [Clonostachys chloroleuca]
MLDVRVKNRDNGSIVSIRTDADGAYHMVARTKIEPGQCILTDPGLAIFPSGLGSGPESTALIKERIDALPEREREVFFTLEHNRLYDYDEYYGRYVAHASVLRHSPEYACIFPLLSLASNSCSPNSVTAVLPTNKTTGNSRRRKGWKLALRACEIIKEGEEINFFKLAGGGRYRSRLENHVERFGYPCRCDDCTLPDDLHLPAEDQRWQLDQLWETAFGRDDVSTLALTHCIGHMAQCCYFESIADKSLLLLYRRLFDRFVQDDNIMRAHVFATKILKINARLIGWECDDFHQGHLMALHDRLHEEFRLDPGIMLRLETLTYCQKMAWLFRWEETLREAEIPETCHDLRNDELFPSYTQLPEDNEDKVSDYFNLYHRPKKHWIFIASLVGLDVVAERLLVRDKKAKAVYVSLNNVSINVEDARDIAPLSLVLIPYAARTIFEDGKEAVSSTNQMIKVISGVTWPDILKLSCMVNIYSNIRRDMRICHGCNKQVEKSSPVLSKCARCGMFWYCSKDCQMTGWKNKGHKDDCKLLGIKVIYEAFCRHPGAMINPIGWELRTMFFNATDWAKLTSKATVSVADLIKKVQPVGVAPDCKTKPANPMIDKLLEKLGDLGPED